MRQLRAWRELSYNSFHRYGVPPHLGYLWNYGVCAIVFFVLQVVSGVFLAMHYTANSQEAFNSVEHIMRDVTLGWFIRSIHLNGASFFFFCAFMHVGRGMYNMSYDAPYGPTWVLGGFIFVIMIITAFTGYVLPWGQMGFWAATVITNLVSTIPDVGDILVVWIWGGFSVNTDTLTRFFAIHYLLPIVIIFLLAGHFLLLHDFGSTTLAGFCDKTDEVPFHPFYTIKDALCIAFFVLFYAFVVVFAHNTLDHPDNSLPSNPLVTPSHVVPEWYFLIFYTILRSIPSKAMGLVALLLSIICVISVPYLCKIKEIRGNVRHYYRWTIHGMYEYQRMPRYQRLFIEAACIDYSRLLFFFFVLTCFGLMFVGAQSMEHHWLLIGRHLIASFFLYFFFVACLFMDFFGRMRILYCEYLCFIFGIKVKTLLKKEPPYIWRSDPILQHLYKKKK